MKRKILFVSVSLLLASSLAGCGGFDDKTEDFTGFNFGKEFCSEGPKKF